MVQLRTDASIEAMRETGRVVAQPLTVVREAAAVGISLRDRTGRPAGSCVTQAPDRRS
ncbi:hypothetical protein [Streptomyces sp. NPDC006510]|uniref:hypothetical protein n=1 Tax=Streptomyces sp. NPDC006510 TaxID=3155600 RepID=UPI0033B5FCB5